jgi:outer membrane biosynthesis protein TonB
MRLAVPVAAALVMSLGSPGLAAARVARIEPMIDKEIIRRAIKKNLTKFSACYERALDKEPGLAGSVVVRFTIQSDGTTADVEAKGMPAIDGCVAKVMTTIVFPKMSKPVHVNYPFTFRPAV